MMQQDEYDRMGVPQHVASIQRFLRANGATLFAKDWLFEYLGSRRDWPNTTIILAPRDEAIRRLEAESKMTFEEIRGSKEGELILENHGSALPTKTEWPMITSWNNQQYGSSKADIDALKPSAFTSIGSPNVGYVIDPSKATLKTSVIVIDAIIIHGDQLVDLKRIKSGFSRWWRPIESTGTVKDERNVSGLTGREITGMNRDVFRNLVLSGQLKGKDVLALCTGNSEIATLCDRDNYALYQQLLKSEFNYEWRRTDLPVTAKDIYKKFHRSHYDIYVRPNTAQLSYSIRRDGKARQSFDEEVEKVFKSDKRPYDHIAIIDEEPFLSLTRIHDLWLLYVPGIPRTATLVTFEREDAPHHGWSDDESDEDSDEALMAVRMSNDDMENFVGDKALHSINPDSTTIGHWGLEDLILYLIRKFERRGPSNNMTEVIINNQERVTIVLMPL